MFSINRIMTTGSFCWFSSASKQDLHRPVAPDLANLDSPGEMTQNGGWGMSVLTDLDNL